jgi:hypothetical protein
MYSNKLAVAIIANSKVLREFEDQVFLPYNSAYSIFIKNKNSVRASVKIEIDGIDATEGVSLVVDPNDEIELERFIKNGNLSHGNSFKFIKRTSAIEKHRGARLEDGLVRIEFQFEKILQVMPISPQPNWPPHNPYQPWIYSNQAVGGPLTGARGCISTDTGYYSSCSSDVGITAPGSISNQEFNRVSNFQLESQKHVIILRLLGEHQGKSVSKTVTTRGRTSCVTCGHICKSTSANFCSQCGTSLQVIN